MRPDRRRYARYFGALLRAWRSPFLVDLRKFLRDVPDVKPPADWHPPGVQPEDPASADEARPEVLRAS